MSTTATTTFSCERLGVPRFAAADPFGDTGVQNASYFESLTLPLELGDVWCRKTNMEQARSIVQGHARTVPHPLWRREGRIAAGKSHPAVRIEWPVEIRSPDLTQTDLLPVSNRLDEESVDYIHRLQLSEAVTWLQSNVPTFFPGSAFEISVLPAEDGDESMLALRVYDALPVSEFREQRHAICQAMLKAGHRSLYEILSIFQRKGQTSGWQVLSWYGSISAQ